MMLETKMLAYLEWRCRRNWHTKYYKYIDEWIAGITEQQLNYFYKECEHLVDRGIYSN